MRLARNVLYFFNDITSILLIRCSFVMKIKLGIYLKYLNQHDELFKDHTYILRYS